LGKGTGPTGVLRYAALLDAVRLVTEGAARDLDSTLDALVAQARRVFGAADATINLREASGTFIRYRASALVPSSHVLAQVGVPAVLSGLTSEVVKTKRAAVVEDVESDPRVRPELRQIFNAPSALVVPLLVEDDVLGTLVVRWTEKRKVTSEDRVLAEALGQHAGMAVQTARLLERQTASEERIARARQDGALETARVVSDRLGNSLASLLLNAEMLEEMTEGEAKARVTAIVQATWRAAEVVACLRSVVDNARASDARYGRDDSRSDALENERTG
jgi:GAF domain-containing protein